MMRKERMEKKHTFDSKGGDEDEQTIDLPMTERSREREVEDEDYIPVIIKRTDESVRHPDDVLENAIDHGWSS